MIFGSDHEDGKTRHKHDDAGDDNAGQLEERLVCSLVLGIVHCRVSFGYIDAHFTPLLTLRLLLCRATYHKARRACNPAGFDGSDLLSSRGETAKLGISACLVSVAVTVAEDAPEQTTSAK